MTTDPSRAFLGAGWPFPLLPDARGRLSWVEGAADVDQSVELLLRTQQGERVMRPPLGTLIQDSLFEADSDQQLHRLESTISDALLAWEPRVEVEEVHAARAAGEGTRIDVTLSYRIRATNTRRSVVFPFYLDNPGALA